MIFELENDRLHIAVKQTGAELCAIRSRMTGLDFMWDGNPDVWGSTSPVLFPVIGAIKQGLVRYKGNDYAVPRHGFIRNNEKVKLVKQSTNSLTFGLDFDEELLKIYPFRFSFLITYTLEESTITVSHRIENLGDEDMLFSLGAHPAFKCPVHADEDYEDYYLEFEHPETDSTWLLADGGLVSNVTKPVLDHSNTLHLNGHLFDNDALIFKNLRSRQVSLRSAKSKQYVTVRYENFPYLGIWAKPNARFVCIEPWLGIADRADSDQQLENKEGILTLSARKHFEASYSIEIGE